MRCALRSFEELKRISTDADKTSVNRFDLYPIDLQTNARTKDLYFQSAYPSGCITVVGDDLIFRDSGSGAWKKLSGISTATSGESAVAIGPATLANRCFFNLAGSNGWLLDVEFIDNAGNTADEILVHERDTSTGAVIAPPLGSFVENVNPDTYEAYNFAFDGPYLYLVRKHISAGTIEIYRFDYTNSANPMELRATLAPSAPFTGPFMIDVDNGFIPMHVYDDVTAPLSDARLLTYDDNTGVFQDMALGFGFYAVQVLFLP